MCSLEKQNNEVYDPIREIMRIYQSIGFSYKKTLKSLCTLR